MILKLYKADLVPILVPVRTKPKAREALDRWIGRANRAELFHHLDSERPIQTWLPAVGRPGWVRDERL